MSIQLQAINAEKNIFRQYELHVGKDIFGTWILTIAYGRISKATQIRTYPFDSIKTLEKRLQQILRKRLSSQKRIGTNYHIISYSALQSQLDDTFLKALEPFTLQEQ